MTEYSPIAGSDDDAQTAARDAVRTLHSNAFGLEVIVGGGVYATSEGHAFT